MGYRYGFFFAFAAAAALGSGGCKDNRPDASAQLISAFQSGCVTQGRWTDAALSHNNALVSVIESLKANDACKPYVSTLGTIQSLSTQINGLLTNQSYADYRLAEEKLQELTLALQGAGSNGALSQALGDELIKTQIDLAEKRAANSVASQIADRDRYAQSTAMLANLMQGMLSQTSGLSACLKQSPSAAIEMATNLLAIGGSFISPIIGAGVAVVGQLINFGVEYARGAGPNDAIWKLYSSQMPLALSCGLEAMTELYCSANDAFDLLELQSQSYPTPGADPQPIWRGLDILGRRLPVLNQWLLRVKNGVRPTDPLEADRQNLIWRKLERLDEYYRNIFAELNYTQKLYDAASGNKTTQDDILVKFIKDSAFALAGYCDGSSCGGGSSSNPFRDKSTDPDNFSCWLVLGVSATCPDHDPTKETGERYIRNRLLAAATVPGLFTNWDGLYEAVKTQVDLEFAQTITADPNSLLASAREAPVDNISPRAVLVLIRDFLQDALDHDDGSNPQKVPLIQDTLLLLNTALGTLDGVNPKSTPLEKIEKIFKQFKLAQGLQFFNERIGNFVEWDVQNRLRRGELPKDITDILRSAGGDLQTRLLASGVRNLVLVSQDLNKARSLTERNIETFKDYFEPSFKNSVEDLFAAVRRSGEPPRGPNRPNGQLLAQLCALTLATGSPEKEWPKTVPWSACQSAVLESIYPDPQGTMTIELAKLRSELAGKPYKTRMCAFHRFLRAGRLAEIMRERPNARPRPFEVFELWDFARVIDYLTGNQ